MKRALQIILVFALAGLAFSGTLAYREVFASAAKCPSLGAPGTITAIVGLRAGRGAREPVIGPATR